MAIEIVDFPIDSMVDLSSSLCESLADTKMVCHLDLSSVQKASVVPWFKLFWNGLGGFFLGGTPYSLMMINPKIIPNIYIYILASHWLW